RDEGYAISVLDLKAEQFCVPQRRRRIFIVASRNDEPPSCPSGILSPIVRGKTRRDTRYGTDELPPPVNVMEALSDLPPLSSGGGEDRIDYDPRWIKTDFQHLMRGRILLRDFIAKRAEQG
ncbi:MAG: DNA cytosine methyltransferase, partial [Candidatus Thorarchaeota archaeon]